MTNDKTVTISRELLANFIEYSVPIGPDDAAWFSDKKELRALLAAPVVERQEPVAYICQSKGAKWLQYGSKVSDPWLPCEVELTPLYTSPPAPVAVVVTDDQLQSLADEAFRKWERIGNPVSGVNGYMAAKAGFREGAAWAAYAQVSLDNVKGLNDGQV